MTPSPIIPWLGRKCWLASRLLQYFLPHDCDVEVFSGGAALSFLREVPAKVEVLNDINGDLVNLYRVAHHPLEESVGSSSGRCRAGRSARGCRKSPRYQQPYCLGN
jgi:DNA adenine methylase